MVVVDANDLQHTEAMLQLVADGVHDIVYVVRLEGDPLAGTVELVSAHVKSVLGYDARDFISDPSLWLRSIHPDDLPAVAKATREMVETRSPVLRKYRMQHHATGEWRLFEDRAAPLFDESGQVIATYGAVHDVTEQEQFRAKLVMTESLAAIGTLATGVAHELNNPLASVRICLAYALEILEKQPASTMQAVEMLREALDGTTRMQEIVQGLTGLARRDAVPTLVDLQHVADVAVRLALASIRGRAELVLRYEPVPRVRAVETRLVQVVINLLVNAAQSIPEGHAGTITLSTHTEADGRAAVVVSDNGVGIPAEHIPRVFEPFFTTKPPGTGTGLGLAVSKHIIDEFGGEIAVTSELGLGTQVAVRFPSEGHGSSPSEQH